MKTLKTILIILLLSPCFSAMGQRPASNPAKRALQYADSLLSAFNNQHISRYIELSYPGIIKYYGGKKSFEDYIQRAHDINQPSTGRPDATHVIQIVNNGTEWQCVIRKTQHSVIDGKNASIISYLVGQSTDNGQQWKFVDVAFNSVTNIVYIMPDVFDSLNVPQRQIVFDNTAIAQQ